MNLLSDELRALAGDYRSMLLKHAWLSAEKEGKWSNTEELGHLVDSAQNNIRRFILAQYEEKPHIIYMQDFWVKASDYKNWKPEQLVELWYLLNLQVASIWKSMPVENTGREADTGKNENEYHSIKWLAADYIKHMKHHLHHILELEPAPY